MDYYIFPFIRRFNDEGRACFIRVNIIAQDTDTAWAILLAEHEGRESHWDLQTDEIQPVTVARPFYVLFSGNTRPKIVLATSREQAQKKHERIGAEIDLKPS